MELVIGESVKETNRTFVKSYTQEYCKAITENYRIYHIRSLEHNLLQERSDVRSYAAEQLKEIKDGTANLMRFRIQEGKKYYKIIQEEYDTFQNRNEYRDGSVHSFVDKNNGNVYKPASWKAPHTKHVRFTFQKPEDIRKLLDPNFVDWAGGYLYLR
tara:strand:- start:1309 stop:1779 length:471 start_codon:yes stop_codon:yes gene_type:complete